MERHKYEFDIYPPENLTVDEKLQQLRNELQSQINTKASQADVNAIKTNIANRGRTPLSFAEYVDYPIKNVVVNTKSYYQDTTEYTLLACTTPGVLTCDSLIYLTGISNNSGSYATPTCSVGVKVIIDNNTIVDKVITYKTEQGGSDAFIYHIFYFYGNSIVNYYSQPILDVSTLTSMTQMSGFTSISRLPTNAYIIPFNSIYIKLYAIYGENYGWSGYTGWVAGNTFGLTGMNEHLNDADGFSRRVYTYSDLHRVCRYYYN